MDHTVSRRKAVGTVGIALGAVLAGCAAESGQQSSSQTVLDETATVKPGEYEAFDFELAAERWVTVSATLSDRSVDVKQDGPGLDVFIMTTDQYTQFQNHDELEYRGGVSMPDVVTGQVSDTVKPGNYIALVDNTARGPANPGDSDVTGVLNIEITAATGRD